MGHPEHIEQIQAALRRLLGEGGEGNFAVFFANREKNRYVQVAGARGGRRLWAEAVSNDYLPSAAQLDSAALGQLERQGWRPPGDGTENHSRSWDLAIDGDLSRLGEWLLGTLEQVYALEGAPLEIDLVLE